MLFVPLNTNHHILIDCNYIVLYPYPKKNISTHTYPTHSYTFKDIEHMNGQRFVNMMLACNLPHHEDLTGPALRVIATAAARGHVKKQEYDSGHTATRIYKSCFSAEKLGRVTTHGRKLSYEDFLNALMRVAKRLNSRVSDVQFGVVGYQPDKREEGNKILSRSNRILQLYHLYFTNSTTAVIVHNLTQCNHTTALRFCFFFHLCYLFHVFNLRRQLIFTFRHNHILRLNNCSTIT